MNLKIITVTAFLLLVPSLAFALAPTPPSIFLLVTPDTQDVAAGDSIEFQVNVLPQGTWVNGETTFELKNPPEGVTATFVPDTWNYPDDAPIIMTLKIATEASQGNIVLNIVVSGRECCFEGAGMNLKSNEDIKLNINGVIEKPDESDNIKQVVNITSTTTTTKTVTEVNTIISYVTQTITTKTSSISTLTTIEQPIQVADLTYPTITLGVVSALLLGIIMIQKKQNHN